MNARRRTDGRGLISITEPERLGFHPLTDSAPQASLPGSFIRSVTESGLVIIPHSICILQFDLRKVDSLSPAGPLTKPTSPSLSLTFVILQL